MEEDEEMLHAVKNDAHSKSCKTKQKEKHLWFNKRRYQKVVKVFIGDILKKFPPDTWRLSRHLTAKYHLFWYSNSLLLIGSKWLNSPGSINASIVSQKRAIVRDYRHAIKPFNLQRKILYNNLARFLIGKYKETKMYQLKILISLQPWWHLGFFSVILRAIDLFNNWQLLIIFQFSAWQLWVA